MFELGKYLQGRGWPTTGRRKVAIVVTCGHQGNPRRRPALYLLHQEVAFVYMLPGLGSVQLFLDPRTRLSEHRIS